MRSHIKVTKKKLMHGGSTWFRKGYIIIIQCGLKKALVTKNKCLVCMTIQPKFREKIAIKHGTLIMKEKKVEIN